MKHTLKLVLLIVAGLILSTNISPSAHAQFVGGGSFESTQQFAPMLEAMKKRIGKKRLAKMMQTFGPMMNQMMDRQAGRFAGGNIGGDGLDMNAMSAMINPEMIGSMTQMFGGQGDFKH